MQDPKLLNRLEELLAPAVVPVLTVARPGDALPLARALADGGLTTVEITLRTPVAISAINAIAEALPGVAVGAGTVRSPEQAQAVIAAGAKFIVSPGMTPRLIEAAQRWPVPFLPGAVTASEAMALADIGYRLLKFFPAEQAGGTATLKALAAPLSDIRFCPTGGVNADNARSYLSLTNVICVGGSWVAPTPAIEAGNWQQITELASAASRLRD